MEWPGALESVEEIQIETSRGDGAPVHRTIVWAVVDQGVVYVRSYRGPDGRWYREALENPDVVIHVAGEAVPARAVHAPDQESIEHATAGFQRKYAASADVEAMVRADVLETTIRLEPR